MIHIPGFTFPVEEFLLEDVVQMIRWAEIQLKTPVFKKHKEEGLCTSRYRPQKKDRKPWQKKGFWQGRNFRPEKEEKEAEYMESWPCYARTLKDRY